MRPIRLPQPIRLAPFAQDRSSCFHLPSCISWLIFLSLLLPILSLSATEKPIPLAIELPPTQTAVDFYTDILPILNQHCTACHGQRKSKGGLTLDNLQSVRTGGDNGPAIVAGKPDESLLLTLASHREDPTMPPEKNKVAAEPLSPRELGLINLWINQGAKGPATATPSPPAWRPLPPNLHPIHALTVTPDDRQVIVARGNEIQAHDIRSGRLINRLPQRDPGTGEVYPAQIRSLAVREDGSLLAAGSYNMVQLWRQEPPGATATNFPSPATSLALSPSKQRAAIAHADHTIRILDTQHGKVTRHLRSRHDSALISLASCGEGRLATLQENQDLTLWDLSSGKTLLTQPLPFPCHVIASFQTNQLVLGSDDGFIRFLDLDHQNTAPNQAVKEWKTEEKPVRSLAIGPKGRWIASAGADRAITIWNTATGEPLRRLPFEGGINAVVSSADGQSIAAAGNGVTLFSAADGEALASIREDGKAALAAEQALSHREWLRAAVGYRKRDMDDAQQARKKRDEAVEKSGQEKVKLTEELRKKEELAVAPREETNTLHHAWIAADAEMDRAKAALAAAQAATPTDQEQCQPDETQLKTLQENLQTATETSRAAKKAFEEAARKHRKVIEEAEKTAEALDVCTRQLERELVLQQIETAKAKEATEVHLRTKSDSDEADRTWDTANAAQRAARTEFQTTAISPDETLLASAGSGFVSLHTVNGGKARLLDRWDSEGETVGIAFLSDNLLLSLNASGTLVRRRLFGGWERARTLGAPEDASTIPGRVTALAFQPGGSLLAAGGGLASQRGTLKFWNVDTGEPGEGFSGVLNDSIYGLAFSPDGTLLAVASADSTVRVLRVSDRTLVWTLAGHTGHVLDVVFSEDGKRIATCGADNTIKLWETSTGEQIRTYQGDAWRIGPFKRAVTSVRFIGASEHLVCASGDATVRLLRVGDSRDLKVYRDSPAYLHAVASTRNGDLIFAGGQDGTLRIWTGYNATLFLELPPPL